MTRAERLNALLKRALPGMAEQIDSGEWGPVGAPYHFGVTKAGAQKLIVKDPETENQYGFVGVDRDELLDQFEARLGQ